MKYIRFFALVAVMMFIASGCKKDEGPINAQLTDEDVIRGQITSIDSLADFVNSDETIINDDGAVADDVLAKTTVAIKPFTWGRKVEHVVKEINIVIFGDTMAIATITKTITGHFIIHASYSDSAKHPDTVITKPYTENHKRKVLFRRNYNAARINRYWTPLAITLVEGATIPDTLNKFSIASLEVILPLWTDTITDPLNTWMKFNRLLHGIPVIHEGDSVHLRLIIKSTDPDTERAVLRFTVRKNAGGMKTCRGTMHLDSSVPDGSGYTRVYSQSFRGELGINMFLGRFNAVIDVFSHGSFYDDIAPFSNRFWELPYMVIYR